MSWQRFQRVLHNLSYFFIILWSILMIGGGGTVIWILKTSGGKDTGWLIILYSLLWFIPVSISSLIFFLTRSSKDKIKQAKPLNRLKIAFLFLLFMVIVTPLTIGMLKGQLEIFRKGGKVMYGFIGSIAFFLIFLATAMYCCKKQQKKVEEVNQRVWKYQEELLSLQKEANELLKRIVGLLESK